MRTIGNKRLGLPGSARSDGRTALGIAAKSPQRSEDLKRKARPAGERPKRN
jgi:hypothetical protein